MKKMTTALVLGLATMMATNAVAETCTPIDGDADVPVADGVRKQSGSVNYCDNGDGLWHFDFYTESGWLFYDGELTGLNVL